MLDYKNKITDADRCLVFIKIADFDFFIFALEDDFYLNKEIFDFQPLEEISDINLEELTLSNVVNFTEKYQKLILPKEKLSHDFLDFFRLGCDYWDFVESGFIPKIIIDYNEKILYQTFMEGMQNHYTSLPEGWKGILDENFFTQEKYKEKYPNLYFWIIDKIDYLQKLYQSN